MSPAILLLLALGLGLAGWLAARARAWAFRRESADGRLRSLPSYHAWYVALWIVLPMVAFIALWSSIAPGLVTQQVLASPAAAELPAFGFQRQTILNEARAVASGSASAVFNPQASALVEPYRDALSYYNTIGIVVALLIAFLAGAYAFLRLKPDFAARSKVERMVMAILLGASLVAILTTIGILASLVFETVRFFGMVSPLDFLFGTHWGPDPMSNPDNPDGSRYGAVPLFWGTLFIGAIIAMIVAIPLGLMSAIYLTQYANPALRKWIKPALEILAGVPTVVYGYFAALTIAPAIRDLALSLGVSNPSSESALAAGLVMGVMIIPFVSSMADDSITAVPGAMRDGSLAMGATRSETIKRVMIPCRPARHRRRHHAGDQPRDRRNHDRRHGRLDRGESFGQSARGDDHGNRADRRHADRRRQFRPSRDSQRLRAGFRPLHGDARAELRRPARRQKVSRSI